MYVLKNIHDEYYCGSTFEFDGRIHPVIGNRDQAKRYRKEKTAIRIAKSLERRTGRVFEVASCPDQ